MRQVNQVASSAVIPQTLPKEPIVIVASILAEELSLDSRHIFLEYEKNLIPKDTQLYVALNYLGPEKLISNVNDFDPSTNTEIQSATFQHIIQVDLMSFGPAARQRKEELAMALNSIYSQQQQELYNMMIAKNVAPFVNASSLEATKWLNRFTTSFSMHAVHYKTKQAQYFDKFGAQFISDQMADFIEADPENVPL